VPLAFSALYQRELQQYIIRADVCAAQLGPHDRCVSAPIDRRRWHFQEHSSVFDTPHRALLVRAETRNRVLHRERDALLLMLACCRLTFTQHLLLFQGVKIEGVSQGRS
jgi:hypothetical protein